MDSSGLILISLLISMSSMVQSIPDNPYVFESDDLPRLENGQINERLLPSIGNGHLASNVFADSIFVNGLYNGRLGETHRARIQNVFSSEFNISGCTDPSRIYRLDTRRALVEEEISCDVAKVSYRTYAHGSIDRVMVTEVHIERVQQFGDIIVDRISLQGDDSDDDFLWSSEIQLDDFTYYKSGTTLEAETDDSDVQTVHIFYNVFRMPFQWKLPEGHDSISNLYIMSIDVDELKAREDFDRALVLAVDQSGDALRKDHEYNWNLIWQSGDITLEGSYVDPFLHETIKGALYYIYSSLPSITSADVLQYARFYGLSPGGLANGKLGKDYNGHVFWDMETWMYPSIAIFRPDLAKAMLDYRIRSIDEAKKRAQSGGYEGARYPWESAFTGAEVTPDICPLCRENQQHITGDIAFAARMLVSLDTDEDWLGESHGGNDFIVEMARFWASRPTFNDTKGQWEINDVMPPDEHQEHANNSIYTNLIANLAVSTARWTSCLAMGQATSEELVPEEWFDKMRNLVFLFNKEKRYHEEFEGFDEQYVSGSLDPRGIKQADVVLLAFPLLWNMPDDVRRNDLELYEPITNKDGPAMTWGTFATSYMDLGDQRRAEELFNRSYQSYVREPFKGTKFDLGFDTTDVSIRCVFQGQRLLEIEFDDTTVIEFPCNGLSNVYPRQGFRIRLKNQSDCPLPRDEINVNYGNEDIEIHVIP